MSSPNAIYCAKCGVGKTCTCGLDPRNDLPWLPSCRDLEKAIESRFSWVHNAFVRDNIDRIDDRLLLVTVLKGSGPFTGRPAVEIHTFVTNVFAQYLGWPEIRVFVTTIDLQTTEVEYV